MVVRVEPGGRHCWHGWEGGEGWGAKSSEKWGLCGKMVKVYRSAVYREAK